MNRVLVVEDSYEILESLQSHLETDGYDVHVATRASQALALVTSHAPNLVILDIELPDRDGFHVLEQIRERGSQVPVLILTARVLESDMLHGFRLGADDYVTKPFSMMALLARVGALLRRARLGAGVGAQPTDAPEPAGGALSDEELHERFGLTRRQIEVARLIADGCGNAEIASRLGTSYFTARNHAEQIMLKLSVPGRAAVGAILYGKAKANAVR
jgi:DNA-binding response OmpR family regulator